MKRLKVTIMVEPVAKARARTIRARSGRVISFTPEKTVHAENLIREKVMGLGQYFGPGTPIRMDVTFFRSRPKTLPKKIKLPVTRPDLDNYYKLLVDSLEKFVFDNDSQITVALIQKKFGFPPRIELALQENSIDEMG